MIKRMHNRILTRNSELSVNQTQIKYNTWNVFTWSGWPAARWATISCENSVVYRHRSTMRCNWIHILRGAFGEPELSPCPRGLAEPLLPPLSRSIAASRVAVFNGSGNRGWLSICEQLGTISWHRGGGGPKRRRERKSRNPDRFAISLASDKMCLLFDKTISAWSSIQFAEF